MPIADVAAAAGFGSVRRFNEVFQGLFHRPPGALRRLSTPTAEADEGVSLRVRYRPPYEWESMLRFLAERAIPGVEVVENGKYFRTVEMDGKTGSIEVSHEPKRQNILVKIRFPLVRSLPAILARVRRLFDTGADIETIDAHLANDPMLAPLVMQRPGLRAPGGWDGFELAVRAVLGQQISVTAARKLAGKLAALHGKTVPKAYAAHSGLSLVFPAAAQLAKAPDLGLGMPAARLATLKAVAEAAVADANLFRPLGSIEEAIRKLKGIRGVGEWTAQYIALRAIREMDAFPATDIGLLRGAATIDRKAKSPAMLLDRAETWRPWRAYAAQHLWAIDLHAVGQRSDA